MSASGRRSWLGALAHWPFALLWSGALVSNVGTWMEQVCQAWLVYEKSHDPLWSGILSFGASLPCALLAIPMGIAADRFDRRQLMLVIQLLCCAIAALQALAAHLGYVEPWMVVAIALLGGAAGGAAVPVWHSLVPSLVPREDLGHAIALNSFQFNFARVLGPILAAVTMEKLGVARAFDLNVLSFALVIVAVLALPRRPQEKKARAPWRQELGEGFSAVKASASIQRTMFAGATYFLLAVPVLTLLPAVADGLDGGVATFSKLLSAVGCGAIAGALALGTLTRRISRSRLIRLACFLTAWAELALVAATDTKVSLVLLFGFGFGWSVLLTATSTVLQLLVPDAVRGRVMSLSFLTFMLAAPLAQLTGGWLASRFGVPTTLGVLAAGVAVLGATVAVDEPPVAAPEAPRVEDKAPAAVA